MDRTDDTYCKALVYWCPVLLIVVIPNLTKPVQLLQLIKHLN